LSFDRARSVYEYTPVISGVIQNFKYNNARYHARFFAEKLFELYKGLGVSEDLVTYVPLSEKREKDRGYNQSKLIASEFSKLSGIELLDCVFKIRETDFQAKLNFEGRVKNLKGAFKADKKLLKNKSVILIDDVLTTGSTANAVSKALKSAGATNVTVLTVASISKTVFYD
jgi:ComF family protein